MTSGKSKLPMVAAAVSHMETFQLPLREIGRRFTKSELVMMGWRSEEQYVDMRSGIDENKKKVKDKPLTLRVTASSHTDTTEEMQLPSQVGEERNLSKLKGADAAKILSFMGIMPPAPNL